MPAASPTSAGGVTAETARDGTELLRAVAYVVSKNLHRRHLNESQRAMIAARIAVGKRGARTDIVQICDRTPTVAEAARMLNVAKQTVANARTVLTGAPASVISAIERACLAAGIEPAFHEWDGDGDPYDYVVSKNLHRRHLNESQRAMIAARLAKATAGTRTDLLEISRRSHTASEAAEMLNVSEAIVHAAKLVQREAAPSQISAIERGEAAVSMALAR